MNVLNIGLAAAIYILPSQCLYAKEVSHAKFLEWLGQISEMEELGVDINMVIEQQELKIQSEESKDKPQ